MFRFLGLLLWCGLIAGNAPAQECDSLPDHFLFSSSSGLSHLFGLDSTSGCNLDTCDELAIYDGGLCVGATVFLGSWPVTIEAYADDDLTPDVDGFQPGNMASLRIWDASEATEIDLVAAHYSAGGGAFATGAVSQLWCECCDSMATPPAPILPGEPLCPGTAFAVHWPWQAAATGYQLFLDGGLIYDGADSTVDIIAGPGHHDLHLLALNPCRTTDPGPAATVIVRDSIDAPASPSVVPDTVCTGDLYCVTWSSVTGAVRYEFQEAGGLWVDVGNATQRCLAKSAPGSYVYQVRACDDCGCGQPSVDVSVAVIEAPGRVSLPQASPNPVCLGEQYCLSWSGVAGATHYEVREDSGFWTNVGSSTQICLTKNSVDSHYYEVRACNECGCGQPSATEVVTVQVAPATPTVPNTGANPVCTGQKYCLSWTAVPTATHYELSENGAAWVSLGDTTSICFTREVAGYYSYRIRAGNSCGYSGASPARTVTVLATPPSPGAPIINVDPACIGQEFCLSWSPIGTATYYEISEDGAAYDSVGNITSLCLTRDSAAIYSFRVRACNSCGCGEPSLPRNVDVRPMIEPPATIESSVERPCAGGAFCISWSTVPGATSYQLRSDSGNWISMASGTQSCYAYGSAGTHVFEVRACDACGCGEAGRPVVVPVIQAPLPPDSLAVSNDRICLGQSICLSWPSAEGAERYEIRQDAGIWTDLGDINEVCYTPTAPGGYSYEIRGCNECGCGQPDTMVTILVEPAPATPASFSASPNPACINQEYCVSWDPVTGADYYELSVDGGDWTTIGLVNQVCYTQGEISRHHYQVRACDECGCSQPTGEMIVAVDLLMGSPGEIQLSSTVICPEGEVCLSWDAVSLTNHYEVRVDSSGWITCGDSTNICRDLSEQRDYVFEVRACGDCGCSDPSPPAVVSVQTAPGTPAQLTLSVDTACLGSDYCLSWPTTPGATRYEYRLAGGNWAAVGDTTQACLTATVVGNHTLELRACSDCGCSAPTSAQSIAVVATPTATPVLTADFDTVCTGHQVCLSWTAVPDAGGYQLRRDDGDWVDLGDVLQYCIQPDTVGTYEYQLRACNGCGCGPVGPGYRITVIAATATPTTLAVSNPAPCAGGRFCLSWDPVPNAIRYEIREGGGGFTSIGLVTQYCLSKSDGGIYSYAVKACGNCGCSGISDSVLVTVKAPPERPVLTDCQPIPGALSLTWMAAAGADSYDVYRDGIKLGSTAATDYADVQPPGGVHKYYVVAVNACGSAASEDTCVTSSPTDVAGESDSELPDRFELGQNYPNPFNPETWIEFALPRQAMVHLEIYNILGRRVRVLVDGSVGVGRKIVLWDGTDDGGKAVSSGVYFYRLQADDFLATRKMLLMR
ncbi:MAG: T9SS type A sorting domain-containing protein [bacterium]